jgi:hypothetical protein
MDAERWQRLSPLLDALIELDGDARQARLAALREEDAALAAEVEALLALEEDNEDFLAEPLVAPPPMAKPDTLIGPYKLDRLLGEGGMGQVWLARRADGLYQRRVALKLLRPGLATRTSRACSTPASAPTTSPTSRWNTSKANRSPTGAAAATSASRHGSSCSCRSAKR